jgi:epsilon-lactone hydrolase
VLYRLAPEHPFPAGLDDAVAVYKALLETYKPSNIGVYGSSAGAILTAEMTARLKQLKVPLPAATGVFSGLGDFSQPGDSPALFALNGLAGHLDPPKPAALDMFKYLDKSINPKDPILSPLYSDLSGFPPTLFITSSRDLLLSGTTILHRVSARRRRCAARRLRGTAPRLLDQSRSARVEGGAPPHGRFSRSALGEIDSGKPLKH